jgi:hypothetical protein
MRYCELVCGLAAMKKLNIHGPIMFRCPNTGFRVQGLFADDVLAGDGEAYEATTCIACKQVHLVNPVTGKVLSVDEG